MYILVTFLCYHTLSCHFSDSIVPSGSHYQVTPKGLNVVLKKASSVKWRALEKDNHRASLNNSSLNSNHVSASVDRKASSGSNSNDYEMNDLDATFSSIAPVQNDFVYLNHLKHDCADTVSVCLSWHNAFCSFFIGIGRGGGEGKGDG